MTLVYIDTVVPTKCEAFLTLAAVRALRVDALTAARVDYTFINVLTDVIDELVTEGTEAAVRSWCVDAIDGARIGFTFVDIYAGSVGT